MTEENREITLTHSFDIKTNMDRLKESTREGIKKYDIVVTEDNIAEAKKHMASINKDKKEFTDKVKDFLCIVKGTICDFKEKGKEVIEVLDEARDKIKCKVDIFEVIKLNKILYIVEGYRDSECSARGIDPNKIDIKDLIILSAVSSSMNLSNKTKESIDNRILSIEAKILKDKIAEQERRKHEQEIAEKARKEEQDKFLKLEAEFKIKAERDKERAVERATLEEKRRNDEERKKEESLKHETEFKTSAERGKKIVVERENIKKKEWSLREDNKKEIIQKKVVENGKKNLIVTAKFSIVRKEGMEESSVKNKINEILINSIIGRYLVSISVQEETK
jgi:hypothetical protein